MTPGSRRRATRATALNGSRLSSMRRRFMHKQSHPSNKLYAGEVRDFAEAMELVLAEFEFEARWSAGDPEVGASIANSYEQIKLAVQAARAIYVKHIDAAMRAAAAEMLASPDENVRWIGDALKDGRYDK